MIDYVIVGFIAFFAIIFAFMAGFNFAIKRRANEMLEKMNVGMLIFDFRNDAEEAVQCQFDKSPREMLDKDFVLMQVKIRR